MMLLKKLRCNTWAKPQKKSKHNGLIRPQHIQLTSSVQQVKEERPLVALVHPHNFLGDVLAGRTHTSHSQEDVVVQEITGK